jgi:hypothetical protein
MIPRCPYCGRPTSFYGLLSFPQPWTRWESCSECRLFFQYDGGGNPLGSHLAFFREDPEREWSPPVGWLIRGAATKPDRSEVDSPAYRRAAPHIGAPGSTIGAWPPGGPGTRFVAPATEEPTE